MFFAVDLLKPTFTGEVVGGQLEIILAATSEHHVHMDSVDGALGALEGILAESCLS